MDYRRRQTPSAVGLLTARNEPRGMRDLWNGLAANCIGDPKSPAHEKSREVSEVSLPIELRSKFDNVAFTCNRFITKSLEDGTRTIGKCGFGRGGCEVKVRCRSLKYQIIAISLK
ncbi:unnamed protein product [Haemonchus placei]|uniref:Uncharacterized protein n=1 Tax=Haemonchus placei TaxID=6290 RepID=A0A0N4X984_HAEPC|nr:unnamed protein product [Haemonchus placei]